MNKELQSTGLSYVCSDAATFHNPLYLLEIICEKIFFAYFYALYFCKANKKICMNSEDNFILFIYSSL